MKTEIKPGNKAPLFTLPGSNGRQVSISDFIGKQNLIVFFYPKDESYGCTKEACGFRDSYDEFKKTGAEVIGISMDNEKSHKAFAVHHRLPFILLSDPKGKVAKLYGVQRFLGKSARATFVIDKEGLVRMKYSSQISMHKHIEKALELVRTL
jgi:peroxiredoxin Q/BCP